MVVRLVVQTGLWLLAMALVLMLAAGDPSWPAGWAFLGEIGILALMVGLWLAWRNPALLSQRLAMPLRSEQPPWDRRFVIGAGVGFVVWLAVMGLDAERLRISTVPPFLQGVGVLLIALAVWVSWLTFAVNRFAVPVVMIQPDHQVIDTGPYAVVRHPMYAGAIALLVGAPLMLGSWIGLGLSALMVAAVGARAVGEERLLRQELPGYEAYAQRVRYRLVPRFW